MKTLLAKGAVAALSLAACANEPTAATAPQPTETPSATPPPPEPAATASAKASASAAAEAPKPSQSSGRPMVLKSDPSEISDTFGSSPGAKLELGDKDVATLRLPEGALPSTTTVITFKIEKGARSAGALVGLVYSLRAVQPPNQTPTQVESNGPPFVLELPLGNRKEASLAIGVEDDKGWVKWATVAAKRIDDSRKVGIFELATLPSGLVHVTTLPQIFRALLGPKPAGK